MSENYMVFVEQPIKLDMLKAALYHVQGKSFNKIMTWDPACDTVFHLVDRHTGEVPVPGPGQPAGPRQGGPKQLTARQTPPEPAQIASETGR